MTDDLRTLVEFASAFAESAFARDRCLVPIFHGVTADGHHVVTSVQYADKDLDADRIKALFAAKGVVACVFLDEAWVYIGPQPSDAEIARMNREGLRHWPGSKEMVAIQAQDNRGHQVVAHREIIRKINSRPRLGPLEIEDASGGFSMGRLADLLPIAPGAKQ